jgi:endonuclease/exonuclease/phosphatase family metal-dependent hydrolase
MTRTRHAGDELVVLTQNAWGGGPRWPQRRERLVERIRAIDPDVVGLQEVHAGSTDGAASQAHELAAALGGYDTCFAPARVAPSGACEGVALLCRRDVREHAIEALTLDTRDWLDRAGQRVVLCAVIELPEGPVSVFVTHLSLSRRARSRTVGELLAFAERERARVGSVGAVLMGDFNATPNEPAIAALEGSPEWPEMAWLDAWAQAHGRDAGGATWPAIAPFRRIDYVFVQPSSTWEVRACDRAPVGGSDHRGVVARLRIRGTSR